MTSQHCLFSNGPSELRETLPSSPQHPLFLSHHLLSFVLFLSLCDHTAGHILNSSRHVLGRLRQSRKPPEGLMETEEEKEKGECCCRRVCPKGLSWLVHINQLNLLVNYGSFSSRPSSDYFTKSHSLRPVVYLLVSFPLFVLSDDHSLTLLCVTQADETSAFKQPAV